MKFAIITIGRSGSSELIDILKSKVQVISKPDNHLYPDRLLSKHGKDVKVIFITRNIKDVIQSLLQRNKDKGIKWIQEHYKNLNSDFADFKHVLEKDTLQFEKLYNSYLEQKQFDVLFIKYECLYFGCQETLRTLCSFVNVPTLTIKYNQDNKWKGNYDVNEMGNSNVHLKWDASLQRKLDSYTCKQYNPEREPMKKIVHCINPFHCLEENPSYLYHAQPITFESMYRAQTYAKENGVNVELLSINYPEDDVIVPDYFTRLPYLSKSTQTEFPNISGAKKLPIIQEIFDTILRESDADYIIFSNSDIGVQSHFYTSVNDIIKGGKYANFIINRRDNIPKFMGDKRVSKDDLDWICNQKGVKHPGKDCFIISRGVLEQIDMNVMFTGYPPWGYVLHTIMQKIDKNTHLFADAQLTFHIGSDMVWKKDKGNKLSNKNEELSKLCGMKTK